MLFFDNFTGLNKLDTKTQRTNSFETKFAMDFLNFVSSQTVTQKPDTLLNINLSVFVFSTTNYFSKGYG